MRAAQINWTLSNKLWWQGAEVQRDVGMMRAEVERDQGGPPRAQRVVTQHGVVSLPVRAPRGHSGPQRPQPQRSLVLGSLEQRWQPATGVTRLGRGGPSVLRRSPVPRECGDRDRELRPGQ